MLNPNSKKSSGVTLSKNLIPIGLGLIVYVVIFTAVYFVYAPRIIERKTIARDYEDFYTATNVDYSIYGLTEEQRQEIIDNGYANAVCPYYLYEDTDISSSEKNILGAVTIVPSFDEYVSMALSSERVLSESKETYVHPAYIDYKASKVLKIDVGDSIKIKLGKQTIDVIVQRIYKSSYLNEKNGLIAIEYSNNKSAIDAMMVKGFQYYNTFIDVKDIDSFKTYLNNEYKPLMDKRDRSEFDSDIDYALYVSSFESRNYNNKSYVNKIQIDEQKSAALISTTHVLQRDATIIDGVLITFASLLYALLYAAKIKHYRTSTAKPFKFCLIHIAVAAVSLIYVCLFTVIMISKMSVTMVKIECLSGLSCILPMFLVSLGSILLGLIINVLITVKTLKPSREQNK